MTVRGTPGNPREVPKGGKLLEAREPSLLGIRPDLRVIFQNAPHKTPPLFSRRFSAVLGVSRQTAKVAAGLLLAVAGERKAGAALIAFDELPTQPVNGLSLQGVTFGFKIGGLASADALFNSNALGANTTLNLQSPTLEGNAGGGLTLDFAPPMSDLSFNVARLTGLTLTGATVALFDRR